MAFYYLPQRELDHAVLWQIVKSHAHSYYNQVAYLA